MAAGNENKLFNGQGKHSTVLSKAGLIFLALAFLAAIILDAFFSDSGILQLWRLERDYLQLTREIKEIEQTNAELGQEIELLEEHPEAAEDIAREELGLVKPGEDIYLFPPEEQEE
jgi:cell division protein FtsB